MSEQILRNSRPRLTVEQQPDREGPYRLVAPLHDPKDKECGFEILDNFERFNQCNDIYTRGQWDDRIRSTKVLNWFKGMFSSGYGVRDAEGYTAKDFALRNAGWMGANLTIQRSLHLGRTDGFLDYIREYAPPAAEKVPYESPAKAAEEIKYVAALFGADLVGITATDKRWHYTKSFATKTLTEKDYDIPEGLPNAIVIATAMTYEAIKSYPSATAGIAVGHGYSRDCELVQTIATYIQMQGYRAVACVNDTSQAIPYAIQAGLGEYGRHGLLITKAFGPRVRIGRIHTDMPLAHDKPMRFGVKEFCEICRRCSDNCPPKAIPAGPPTDEIFNQSNIVGIRKWTVDAEKCFKFWVNQGTECGICIRVCPYNKDASRWYDKLYMKAWQRLAASPLRKFALWLDIKLGFGKRRKPGDYWKLKPGR
ncbi:MAG: reductive dehalogenase [Alphaproteobacteria bacterium]